MDYLVVFLVILEIVILLMIQMVKHLLYFQYLILQWFFQRKIILKVFLKDGNITITYDHCGDEEADQILCDGDTIYFEKLFEMPELNNKSFTIKNTRKDEFELEKPTGEISIYTYGGHFYKIKKKESISFKSLEDSLKEVSTNWLLILEGMEFVFRGLWRFKNMKKRLPRSYDVKDALELIEICHEFGEEVDDELIKLFSFTCGGSLAPVNNYLASFVSNEILKGVTGIGYPNDGFYYYNALETLPDILPKDVQPVI